jgi:hypothetical protein
MEPLNFFGRNGFINSDFTPLIYLVDRFWPMSAGVLIANWEDFFRKNPWKRVLLPFQKRDGADTHYGSRIAVSLTDRMGSFRGSIPIHNHSAPHAPVLSFA